MCVAHLMLGLAAPVLAGPPPASLLERFEAAFGPPAPGTIPGDEPPASPEPGGCGTPLVREYLAQRDLLPSATVAIIDRYLSFTEAGDTLLSAGGRFRLVWTTEGDNAVPLADESPLDGVPDFITRMARHLEEAWAIGIDEAGLRAPPATPLEVSFRRMHFYGYTVPVDPAAGTTRLVLHNTFSRFPPNDDPEGDAAGSAKVTAAHEFRHASQYAGSRWAEGDWTELDATWAEERTFPLVNDYHHYLLGDSPVRRPQLPLDAGATGTGSYDDAVFEVWLHERWGDDLLRDYWDHRANAPQEEPLASWDAVLEPRGASLAATWGDFIGWNFATGARALVGQGYPDAADYPAGEPAAALVSFPGATAGTVEHLAAAPVVLAGLDQLGEALLRVDFAGDDEGGPLALALHVQKIDGDGYLEVIGLDRRNDARVTIREPASSLRSVGLVVGNPSFGGEARSWTVAVDTVPGPAAPAEARLVAIEPNPCNPAAWLDCRLTARADVTLEIVDLAGRRVRSLWQGSLGPGAHRFRWDGRSDAGRPAPAGAYVARLSTNRGWEGRKLTLVR